MTDTFASIIAELESSVTEETTLADERFIIAQLRAYEKAQKLVEDAIKKQCFNLHGTGLILVVDDLKKELGIIDSRDSAGSPPRSAPDTHKDKALVDRSWTQKANNEEERRRYSVDTVGKSTPEKGMCVCGHRRDLHGKRFTRCLVQDGMGDNCIRYKEVGK